MSNICIAVIYHSGYGHTARQADAVKTGIERVDGAQCLLLTVEDTPARWSDLLSAEAIIFGTPTYVGGPSAAFKSFQEASSNAVMAKGYLWKDKIAAGFTNSGTASGDKLATLMQLALFAAQHGMHWINLDLPPSNHSTTGSPDDLNRLGFGWAPAPSRMSTRGPISRRRHPISPQHGISANASPRPRCSSCVAERSSGSRSSPRGERQTSDRIGIRESRSSAQPEVLPATPSARRLRIREDAMRPGRHLRRPARRRQDAQS